jgi:hypothetical protein
MSDDKASLIAIIEFHRRGVQLNAPTMITTATNAGIVNQE